MANRIQSLDEFILESKITTIDELPKDTQELVDKGKVTYRGMGFGKEGTKIKVNGKEYVISDEDFEALGGIKKIRFAAPYRKG